MAANTPDPKKLAEILKTWEKITEQIKKYSAMLEGDARLTETAKAAYERIETIAGTLQKHATKQSELSAIELRQKRAQIFEERKLLEISIQRTKEGTKEKKQLEEQLATIDALLDNTNQLIKEQSTVRDVMKSQTKALQDTLKTQVKNRLEALSFTNILKFAYNAILQFDDQATKNQQTLGLSATAARNLTKNLKLAGQSMGYAFEETINANLALNEHFGVATQFSNEMIGNQLKLVDLYGLSNEEALKASEYTALTGKSQTKIAENIGKATGKQINQTKILKEVLKVEGQLASQYKNDPILIAKAVEKTEKLGISMQQAQKASQGLLDFESSIANELEAELLTGKDLNLEKARYLALQGDSAGAAEEMIRQVGGLAEYNKLNVIQQESLARSMGMSADEMADSLRKQEQLKAISRAADGKAAITRIQELEKQGQTEEANDLRKQLAAGKTLAAIDKEVSARKQMERQSQLLVETMSNVFDEKGTAALKNILQKLSEILTNGTVQKLLGIAGAVGGVLAALGAVTMLVSVFKNVKNMLFGAPGSNRARPMWTRSADGMSGPSGPNSRNRRSRSRSRSRGGGGLKGLLLSTLGGFGLDYAMDAAMGDEDEGASTVESTSKKPGNKPNARPRDAKGRFTSKTAPKAGGGNWFTKGLGKVGNFFSGVGKSVSKGLGKLNPMAAVKKALGSPIAKGIGKVLGPVLTAAMSIADIYSLVTDAKAQDAAGEKVDRGILGRDIVKAAAYPIANLAMNLIPGVGNAISLVDGILGSFGLSPIKWITDNLIDLIPSEAFSGLGDLAIGKSKKMAKGGVVTRATNIIAGEAGPEAIIPLTGTTGPGLIKQAANSAGGGDMVAELRAIKQVLSQILAKEGDIKLDSVKVGTALNVGTYRLQ